MTVETLYHAIAPDARIVFTEVIGAPGDAGVVSLVTITFADAEAGTDLTVTLQSVSIGARDNTEDVRMGWTASLENLERYLSA